MKRFYLILISVSLVGCGEKPKPDVIVPVDNLPSEEVRHLTCKNNLKEIALAMWGYEATKGNLPASVTVDAAGKPLLSWRVMILPYMGHSLLYNNFVQEEPWDGPNNKKLIPCMPMSYVCTSDVALLPSEKGMTKYRVCASKGTIFEGKKSWKLSDITDETSDTILVFESTQETIWTKPEEPDFELAQLQKIQTMLGSKHPGGFNASFADFSVRFIKSAIEPSDLKALFTRGGGESIPFNALFMIEGRIDRH